MKLIGLFSFIVISVFLMTSSLFADPLDTYDGTEEWYKDRISDNGLIVYYDPTYEKDMKIYISYLKRKQKKSIFKQKSILSKLNVHSTTEDNDEKIGDLGSVDKEIDLKDNNDDLDEPIDDTKKGDLFLIDKKTDILSEENKKTYTDDDEDDILSDEDKRLEKKKKRLKKEAEALKKQEDELENKKKKLYKDSNKYNEDGFVDDEELEDLD